MDGVPGITQSVIQPGEKSLFYTFTATLSGTYWYHSHENSAEQLLEEYYGAIVIEESTFNDLTINQVVFINEWSSKD
ncbi:multicopper oxidase domain-containing protein [Anaerobacillus sp. HL2]|nr:multicopper oxidase domain-containing protein [Anaerobacillus sp. HL2]